MKTTHHPAVAQLSLPTVLSALGDPVRLRIVRSLADGRELGWGELTVPVGKSTLSHHLKVLRAAGVTRTREEGTRCYVRLRLDDLEQRFPGLMAGVLPAVVAEAGEE
ncbi:transcriptional regulator, ArsR family [Streptomyces zhaozhouensis]|uniref:Transcriptional regulator, ArsR family n=1 Tax=Streptomyces zhaozhouensis TaxID=1300267 RepID=A0A286DZ44_9ACTN|nr:metalloregulator ArsR/SmtB family transcription factor [Streptomyces zhaozhouensis]SOD63936.1 transcriptional regulator, ArsR family [Streptomyces zhaozhouensis]